MFKKLKDKIAEEVKSSPQRIQQLTQSVTDRLQNATNDESLFTLGDDDTAASNTSLDAGFTNVSLRTPTPVEHRARRYSNSSMASDSSFLPHYEPSTNLYHMQSDLDVSASEIEDNASMSSQLGHITKEQVYAAFQKAQMRYHKYRGRYSDLRNHYKLLEKENAKIKAILVETQDKTIRRVSELREQCSLEQKAKAHLENALRVELDERQIKIDTLETKIKLLKNGTEPPAENYPTENLEFLTKHLNEARIEIERLNARIQEMKANTIIFNTKEGEYKQKIKDLEKALHEKTTEHAQVCEKEKEASLKLAQVKMDLHLELHNRDVEISNLKQQASGGVKLENLQSQNAKLIEKVELLSQKCQNYESELIKLEQYKIENTNLNEIISNLRRSNETNNKSQELTELQYAHEELTEKLHNYTIVLNENEKLHSKVSQLEEMVRYSEVKSKENESLKSDLENLRYEKERLTLQVQELEVKRVEYEDAIEKLRESARASLISLESKIKDKITGEYEAKEAKLKDEFQQKLQWLTSNENDAKLTEVKLMESQEVLAELKQQLGEVQSALDKEKAKYFELENNHLDLIDENSTTRNALSLLEKENIVVENDFLKLKGESSRLQEELDGLKNELSKSHGELSFTEAELASLNKSISKCELDLTTKTNECTILQNEITLLQDVLSQQQNENLKLQETTRQATKEIENLTLVNQKLTEDLLKSEGENVKLKSEIQELSVKSSTDFENLKDNEAHIRKKEEDCKLQLDEIVFLKKETQRLAEDLLKNEAELKSEIQELSTELENLKRDSVAQIRKNEKDCRLHLEEIASLKKENQRLAEDLLKNEVELKNEIQELSGKNFTELENLKRNSEIQIRKNEEDCRLYLDEIDSLKKENQRLTEDLLKNEVLKNQIQELSTKSSRNFENLKRESKAQIKKNEEDYRLYLDEIASLKKENQKLMEDLLKHEELKNEIQELSEKNSLDFESLKRESEAQIRKYEEDCRLQLDEIASLKREALKSEEKDLNAVINEKEKELNVVKQAMAETEANLTCLTLQQGDILIHLNNLEQLTEKLQQEKDTLTKEKDEQASLLRMVQDYEKEISAENAKLKSEHEKAVQKQKDVEEKLSETAENLKKQNEDLILKLNAIQKESEGNSLANRHLQNELSHLRAAQAEIKSTEEDNKKYIATLQAQLNEKIQMNQTLEEKLLQLRQVQMKYDDLLLENDSFKNKLVQVNNEIEELQKRNLQLSSDYKQILDEHERNIAEFEASKLKHEGTEHDLKTFTETKTKLEAENRALTCKLEEVELQLRSLESEWLKQSAEVQTVSLQNRIAELELIKSKYDLLCDENSLNKSENDELKLQHDKVLCDKKALQSQLEELERHYNEIEHERQLLKDEIEELKTSPVIYNSDNDVQEKYLKEIESLREKCKSLDEANRTSIKFYETELEKLKVKNEKLNRNLDETLVTLPTLRNEDHNDSADVLEYLRNVLFNYMTGKEGLVLAKVIAAVCKFDRQQTELIIQREQQKQTLLGHLFGS